MPCRSAGALRPCCAMSWRTWCCWLATGAACGGDHRRRSSVRAAPAGSAAASCLPGPAITGPGSIGLLGEVEPGGDEHDEDGGGDPVDDQAERRPPASVGHKLAPV